MNRFHARASLLAMLVVGLPAVDAVAQSRNVTLVGRFDPPEFVNDCWGYVDPSTGKEYAILLSSSGSYVLDCSNPAQPVQRGFFARAASGNGNTWRDARTFGHYLYIVSEAGGGMQIVDLSNPDAPQFVTRFNPSGVTWSNTHNLSIDTTTGIAYACGTRGGMLIFDLNQNPTNPTYLGAYTTQYVHDMQVQDGFGFLSEINRDYFRIVDVTNLPSTPSLGFASQQAAHQAWPTRDGDYVVCCTEDYGYGLQVYDVRNPATPTSIATWRTGGTRAVVHNAFIYDRTVHVSYYSEGYRALDLTDPANPIEVGYYDTSSFTSDYEGAWGCYPFLPSGHVYVSDMDGGLYVFKPESTSAEYGTGTAGASGVAPRIHTFGSAWIGNANFGLEVAEAPANASVYFLIGAGQLALTYQGQTLLVDTTIGGVVPATTDAQGDAHIPVPVPNVPALVGAQLYVQAFVVDATGPLGFASTSGRQFGVYQR